MREELVEIKGLEPRGDGVAYLEDGRSVYVPRSAVGDKLRVKVHENKQGILRGSILEEIELGADRAEPPCPYFKSCGGCQLQHISEQSYRTWKLGLVQEALRIRRVVPEEILDPIFVPAHSRRRTSWAVKMHSNGHVDIGYNQQRTHSITPINDCTILCPELNDMLTSIIPYLKRLLRNGRNASIFAQRSDTQTEILITGDLASKRGEMDLKIMEAISDLAQDLDIARISWRAKDTHTARVMLERESFIKQYGRLTAPLPPGTFMQPTAQGEQALVKAVMGAVEAHITKKKPRFADLFAGSGCFSGHLSGRGSVDAFEFSEDAIQTLSKAVGGLGIQAHERNLFERPLSVKELASYDAVIFDPPRAGAKEQAAELAQSKVPLVVAISCNPRSFARDAALLTEGGYRLRSLQCVDQFVYSSHVEVIGVFTR
jgi:23S rRNA (uracil1939-C5)-methyltransferase